LRSITLCMAILAVGIPDGGAVTVRASAQGQATCQPKFVGTLQGILNDDGRTFQLSAPYVFRDSKCRNWQVPEGATVDGASIPRPLWSLIGGPFEGKYRNASVIHDWFCDRRTRPWQHVHRMFYDGMLAMGVPSAQANLMYMAVYYGGPRWSGATVRNNAINVSNCRACASTATGSKNDGFSTKAADQQMHVVFPHQQAEISDEILAQFSQKLDTDKLQSPEQIEEFVRTIRDDRQTCPTNWVRDASGKICQPAR
jgi:Protein of unknown function (DUF1353)